MNEHDYALRDAHMADAVGTYFKARPQLMRTIHEERIYEAGFKAAWDRLQSALSEATARAERAEAELKKAREQEPVAWKHENGNLFLSWQKDLINTGAVFSPLYAAPIPAPAAQVPQEPIATVYIGSGHCKVAFTDAAKEAMKGRQGQSFDVYADPMPRTVKESLTVESVAAQVPKGWIIRHDGDVLIVQHPDVGGCAVQKEPDCDRMIPEAILWALASDLLQEAKP